MRIVVCLCLCVGLAFPAYSLPIIFDFSSVPDDFRESSSFTTAAGGLSLFVEASSDNRDYASITWAQNNGLGVRAETESTVTMDGSGGEDRLLFRFEERVQLLTVGFSAVNDYDVFELWVEGNEIVDTVIDPSGISVSDYDFSALSLLTDSFSVRVSDNDSAFRIKSITVDFAPVPAPEPSTWLLLASGVSVLLCWRRSSD